MKIAVIDGLGGGLGVQIISRIKKEFGDKIELFALGTNSGATTKMLKEGADIGATGENAIRVNVSQVDLVVGPLGIIIPNSMRGEVTPGITEAVANCEAEKLLLGIKQPHVNIIGIKDGSINDLMEELIEKIKNY